MAKGKRTYVGFYSTLSGKLIHVTNIQKKNFAAWVKGPSLRKYDPVAKKHVSTKEGTLKMKEIKKG